MIEEQSCVEHSVDIGTVAALQQHLREPVLRNAIRVF
jgi:hypothetical protein